MNDSLLTALKKQIANTDFFQRTLQTIGMGESVVWEGCLGSSYTLLGSVLSEQTNRTVLIVVSKVALVERVAADLALFTEAPVLTYPILTTSSIENSDEVFLSEDADFGMRLRVLKALDKRTSRAEASKNSKKNKQNARQLLSLRLQLLCSQSLRASKYWTTQ